MNGAIVSRLLIETTAFYNKRQGLSRNYGLLYVFIGYLRLAEFRRVCCDTSASIQSKLNTSVLCKPSLQAKLCVNRGDKGAGKGHGDRQPQAVVTAPVK